MSYLPVIFRAERSGEFKGQVTAVFPTVPFGMGGLLTTYAHVGQHGAGDEGWYRATRPATPEEAAPLLIELRSIYECDPDPTRLQVCERWTAAHRKAFNAQLSEWQAGRC